MPDSGCDLVAGDRGEVRVHVHVAGSSCIIYVSIMFCRNGQFDAFARDGKHTLVKRRVTVPAMSQSMDVGVTSNPPWRRNFTLDGHPDLTGLAGGNRDFG